MASELQKIHDLRNYFFYEIFLVDQKYGELLQTVSSTIYKTL
jgi:hypothetical protein